MIETRLCRSTLVCSLPSRLPSSSVFFYSWLPARRSTASRSTSLVTHLWACTGPEKCPRRRVYARENSFKPIRNFNRVGVRALLSRRSLGSRTFARIKRRRLFQTFDLRARVSRRPRAVVCGVDDWHCGLVSSVPLTTPSHATRHHRRLRGRVAGIDA
jgi:hypothetical protein